MNNKWLENLKVDDTVIIMNMGVGRNSIIARIDRFTKTQIVLKGSITKYRRDSGDSVGNSGFYGSFLAEATQEAIDEIKQANLKKYLLNKISEIKMKDLDIPTLEKVLSATKDVNEEK